MQLENLLSMDQVQTITIVALFLVSTVGGGGLVAVNNEANENSEKVDTLAQATWDFVLAVEGMQNAFEDAFEEDRVRMDDLESRLNSSGVRNTKPLIFVDNFFLDSTGSGGNGSLVASAVDFDGYVERFGIDHDLDGQIDLELFDESNFIYSKSYDIGLLSAKNSPYQDGLVYIDACIARVVVIAIDNQGGTSYTSLQVSTNEDPDSECNPIE